jgi:hypothetical protein
MTGTDESDHTDTENEASRIAAQRRECHRQRNEIGGHRPWPPGYLVWYWGVSTLA